MKTDKKTLQDDDAVISLDDRRSLSMVVGQKADGDKKFASVIDLGDIDQSRTKGADAAYKYLNGEPGEFRVMTTKTHSPKSVLAYTILVFAAGALATYFAFSV